jgi:hypothetical protein
MSPGFREFQAPVECGGMIVYADPKTRATVAEARGALAGLEGDDRLVAEGMLEQALADLGEENPAPEQVIELKTPEGFAFYQLHPEQYRRAARRWLRESGVNGAVVVIGIRSIGTSLSRVVAEEIGNCQRCTVRTKGDPFSRAVTLPEWIDASAAAYMVVDEGPGLSGSSFAAVCHELELRGVPRAKIHFFPSHSGEPGAAASDKIREVWREVRRWVEPEEWPQRDERLDWKYIGPTLPWPFDCSGEAERFARRNSGLSCGIPVMERNGWWLGFEKISGTPAEMDAASLARHIVAVADAPLRIEDEIETEERLREMLAVNVEKHFRNPNLTSALQYWLEKLRLSRRGPSSGDGHLEPENWIRDAKGKIWKLHTTGSKLSHMTAYRLPYLWDVAQAMLEWNLETLPGAWDRRELAFHQMAYAALELGKSVLFERGDAVKWERALLRALGREMVW